MTIDRAETGSSRPSAWDDRPRIDKAGQNRTGGRTNGSRTHIANRGSNYFECITAIRPDCDAAGKVANRNSGANVLNMDISHIGKAACRLFR